MDDSATKMDAASSGKSTFVPPQKTLSLLKPYIHISVRIAKNKEDLEQDFVEVRKVKRGRGRPKGVEKPKRKQIYHISPPCDECGKVFNRKETLRRHMLSHTDVRESVCDECGSKFKSGIQVRQHIARCHSQKSLKREDKNPGVCYLCGKECPSERSLTDHMNTHSPDFACKRCNKTFGTKRYLNDHISAVHEGVPRYNCNVCGKSFATSSSFSSHTTRKHSDNPDQLKPRPISIRKQCPLCPKMQFSAHFTAHIKRVHEGIKEKCQYCSKEFGFGLLRKHTKRKHGGKKSQDKVDCANSSLN